MHSTFDLRLPRRIIFGPGKFQTLATLIPQSGRHPLVVLGNSSFKNSATYAELNEIFSSLATTLHEVHIADEPSPQLIDSIVESYKDSDIDLVIAIGGGSTIDGGKAISAMLKEDGNTADFLEGVGSNTPTGMKTAFIAIPTTSGTGSEATANAVISEVGREGYKKSLRHDNYIADIALVDPALTISCPQHLTAVCAMDCFTQLTEGYLSTKGSSATENLALDGIHAIQRSLRAVFENGQDLSARTDLAYASFLSGIVLTNAGLGTVHGFASVIGGLFPIPHGVVCGTLMAPVNKITLQRLRQDGENRSALNKYTRLGKIFTDQQKKSDQWYQDSFIAELESLSSELAIPPLNSYGLQLSDRDRIASLTGNKNNPVCLTHNDLVAILTSRIA